MHKRILFVLLPLFVACTTRLAAISYFVDFAEGSDENHGTGRDAPWKHCPGDAAAVGRAAVCLLVPGDVVVFRGGVTYVFDGAAGIALKSSGEPGNPIIYDGNSSGEWGEGRARFSDNHGSGRITAFAASAPLRHVTFRSLEFGPIGGAAELPVDQGTPVASRFGGGVAFPAGCQGVTIVDCGFHDLGFAFNGRPMNAAAIAGSAITAGDAVRDLTITRCEFSRLAVGLDLARATLLNGVVIGRSVFSETIVWPFNLPPVGGTVSSPAFAVQESKIPEASAFDADHWTGYGPDPRTEQFAVREGGSITLVASALASPAATFEWAKNGRPIEGATASELSLKNVTAGDAATYTVMAKNSEGAATSNSAVILVTPRLASTDDRPSPVASSPAPLTSAPPPPGVSVTAAPDQLEATAGHRAKAPLTEFGLRTLTADAATATLTFALADFVPRQVLIRAAGPTLALLGVRDALRDPRIALFCGEKLLASNDDWEGRDDIMAAVSRLGTFPFESPTSKDAALLLSLGSGDYRVVASAGEAAGGTVLIEVCELP